MAFVYTNPRRLRLAAIEQAIPISLVRRCFIQAVVVSAVPGIEHMADRDKPDFRDVCGEGDAITHDLLLKWEMEPFVRLGYTPRQTRGALDEVLLLRERVMRPYGKLTIFSAVMVCTGILVWLVENGLYSFDEKPDLLAVIETVKETVRAIDPKKWDALEQGTLRTATFILADLAREGFGFGATEQQWREAFGG